MGLNIGGSGSSKAYVKFNAKADKWFVRGTDGKDAEIARPNFLVDFDNVATSLAEAASLCGMEVVVSCPPGYERDVAGAAIVHDPADAVADAHAVYTDVWVSMGDEAEAEQRLRDMAPYQVNEELLARARPYAVFMHCLPAHRGQEVTAEVIDGPRSLVWPQAENRLPTEEDVLYALVKIGRAHV